MICVTDISGQGCNSFANSLTKLMDAKKTNGKLQLKIKSDNSIQNSYDLLRT